MKYRMFMRVLAAGATIAFVVSSLRADDLFGLRKGRRRIQPKCSVPPADYQFGAQSTTVTGRTLPAVEVYSSQNVSDALNEIKAISATPGKAQERPWALLRVADAGKPVAKMLQMDRSRLTIEHCQISDVAIRIEPSGMWQVSLRADQNYVLDHEAETRNVELHMKRNRFHTKILLTQPLAGVSHRTRIAGTPTADAEPKRIVLSVIELPPYWVQREAATSVVETGYDPAIARHFQEISQAEIEFYVDLDSLTGSGEGVISDWQERR